MQDEKSGKQSNGRSIAIIGVVLLLAMLAAWLITDTFFTMGLFIAVGFIAGGLFLTTGEKKRAT